MAIPLPGRVEITFFRVGGSVNCCDSVNTKEKRRVEPPPDSSAHIPLPALNLENVPRNYVLCFKREEWLVRPPGLTDDWPTSHNKKVQENTLKAVLRHFQQQLSSEYHKQLSDRLPQTGWLTVNKYCEIAKWVSQGKTSPDDKELVAFPPAKYILKYNSRRGSLDATPLSLGDRLPGNKDKKTEAWRVIKQHFERLSSPVKEALQALLPEKEDEWLTVGKYREIFQAVIARPEQGSSDRTDPQSSDSFPRAGSPGDPPSRRAGSSPIAEEDLLQESHRSGSE